MICTFTLVISQNVSNFTRLTAREITYNNFEISLVVFMPNITTNHSTSYTNLLWYSYPALWGFNYILSRWVPKDKYM